MQFEILKFDSELFGFKVAKILPSRLSITKLKSILAKLRSHNVRLVYWQAANTSKKSQKAIQKLHGFLASHQIRYLVNLKKITLGKYNDPIIKIYRRKTPTTEMKKLAVTIGEPSRFGVDPQMPRKLLHKMYHAWIKNSVNGQIADKVLVIKNKKIIIGMITLGHKNKRGDIGLTAINQKFQGKNFGTKLVQAAQRYFIKKGYTQAQVVTQKTNISACKLYAKCGFRPENIDNFYHFWL